MVVLDYLITILSTAIVVALILYLFFFKPLLKIAKEEQLRFYREQDIGMQEVINANKQLEERKDYGSNLVKKE